MITLLRSQDWISDAGRPVSKTGPKRLEPRTPDGPSTLPPLGRFPSFGEGPHLVGTRDLSVRRPSRSEKEGGRSRTKRGVEGQRPRAQVRPQVNGRGGETREGAGYRGVHDRTSSRGPLASRLHFLPQVSGGLYRRLGPGRRTVDTPDLTQAGETRSRRRPYLRQCLARLRPPGVL